MNPEQPRHHRNELNPINTQLIEDAVRIAETKAIIAGADEQIEALAQQGRHDVAALLKAYRDAAQKEYDLRENLRTSARFTTERNVIHDDADAQPGSEIIEESVKLIPQSGSSPETISVLQELIEEAFTQREFYHETLQKQFPDENLVINKKLREMRDNGPIVTIN